MLRCKSTSSSEHKETSKVASEDKETSKVASEHKDSVSKASELSRTEGGFSELVGTKWVSEGRALDLMLPIIEGAEKKGREGGACDE